MISHGNFHQISSVLRTISHPSRIAILLAIGEGETCVCHLERILGMSQSHISQQLMALRQAGVVVTRRERRFVHYRLTDPTLLSLIHQIARMEGLDIPVLKPTSECGCSNCCKKK